nr:hypothetical protein BaRGS_015931 [Batillaria attramentaria]
MTWRRQLSRQYGSRDLKCFVGILILLVVTIVGLMLRSQTLETGDDVGFMFEESTTHRVNVRHRHVDSTVSSPGFKDDSRSQSSQPKTSGGAGGFPRPFPSSTSDLKDFKSPYIRRSSDPYRDLKLTREDKREVTSNKVITWYAVAATQLPEDLFDDDVFDDCPAHRCRFVKPEMLKREDKDKVVDAIIFPGVAGRDKEPPSRTHPDQVFIYYDMEAPMHPAKSFGSQAWNSIFNWTWSYRRDADIWQPAGFLQRVDKVKPSTSFKDIVKAKNKHKVVAWFANTCNVPSKRDQYVRELQKHIQVDMFGQCGNLTCPKGFACLETLSSKYFFYLSFEDALCKDYVTDKFFDMFLEDIHLVPVVLGGADYESFFPQGTYIDASWFSSPKDLAEFLKFLMEDKKTYTEFLWRKSHFVYTGSDTNSALCQLCQQLHSLKSSRRTYPDFQQWYRTDQCKAPRPV